MGSTSSQPTIQSPGKSPGMSPGRHTHGAYGRLRIDSPKQHHPHHPHHSHHDLPKSAAAAAQQRTLSLDRIMVSTEVTPLFQRPPLLAGAVVADKSIGMDSTDSMMAGGSPPLALWIGPALACALAYALYNIFIKKGSATIHPILGGVILQFVAALLGCMLLTGVYLHALHSAQQIQAGHDDDDAIGLVLDDDGSSSTMTSLEDVLMYDRAGVGWAVLAGVAVGAAEMISFCVSGMGVQAMQSIPIIIGGSVMFGTLLGYGALGETLSVRGWTGVVMISMGISLVGMDDSGEMGH